MAECFITRCGGGGNPYLRYDEDADMIQAQTTKGTWLDIYETDVLPLDFYKLVTWADGTDEDIVAMVQAADNGLINLADYWSVGDERTVHLSAMSATGVGESHVEQDVTLVLMHAGGVELANGKTCNFVVGMKNCLKETGYMNSSGTNSGSWNGSARRTWCNSVFKNAIPSTLLPIFKQANVITAESYSGSTNQTSQDYFWLPAEKEVFGERNYSNSTEFNALFQFDYYKTSANRIKRVASSTSVWWGRSPYFSTYFFGVEINGTAYPYGASATNGIAPHSCI